MQNGAFPWVSPSSLAAASQKSPWPGYQASLTDLFLKKNPLHQFATSGISQLAAASSYLEKMSTLSGPPSAISAVSPGPLPGPSSGSPTDILLTHSTHPHPHPGLSGAHKCPHPEFKDKPYPCDICQQYSSICVSAGSMKPLDITTTCSSRMNPNDSSDSHKSPHFSGVPASHLHPHPAHLHPPPSGIPQHHHHHHHHTAHRRSSAASASSSTMSRSRNSTNKQFLCPVCHKLFTQKGNLKTHMMIHTGDKPYACHICGKSFTQKGNVDTHMKIHTGEKDYGCDSCGKRFTQKGNLKTHVRSVHTKEKPFACGVCGKSFSQKGNMQTHIRTHNKDDRFPCSLCGKTFSQKGNLKTHMQRHAGTLPAKRYGQRRQVGHSRLLQVHASQGPSYSLGAPESSPRDQSQLNRSSTDEDSPPPIEHSIASQNNRSTQQISQQQHPHQHHGMSTPDETMSPQNLQLKYAHQSSASRDPLSALTSLQNPALHSQSQLQPHHRSPGSSPISPDNMSFGSCSAATAARVLYSTPTSMPAPLAAHTSSWLAAAGASSNLATAAGHKTRGSTNPYEAFPGLTNPYGSFAAVQASPLSRLSLFTAHSGAGIATNESHLSHHHKQQHPNESNTTSAASAHASSASQHQFQTSNPNPDFSQLLE